MLHLLKYIVEADIVLITHSVGDVLHPHPGIVQHFLGHIDLCANNVLAVGDSGFLVNDGGKIVGRYKELPGHILQHQTIGDMAADIVQHIAHQGGTAGRQLAAAAVTGMIAKENVVGTLAVCFVGLENLIDTEELALMEGAGAEVASVFAITKVAALAYLMFNLFTPPCFAALGAMRSEIDSRKWFWGGVGLQFATGYTVAFLVYQIGTFVTEGTVGAGFVPGLIAVAAFAAVIVRLIQKANKGLAAECAAKSKK